VHASTGAGFTTLERKGEDEDDVERGTRGTRRVFLFFDLSVVFSARSAISALIVVGTEASQSAPPAAMTFKSTPTHVVPRRPSAGISQNPAAIAPTAAPAVFAAYSRPVSPASQFAATGKVAPIAAAGTPSSARLMATRTSAKRPGAAPSA
jgi:hypothetical protein